MCYDLLVLVLSIAKLSKQPSNSPLKERLRVQGLLYFAVAAVANVLPTVRTLRSVPNHILILIFRFFLSLVQTVRFLSLCGSHD